MAGVRIQWAKFGKVDSFNIYRSETPIDISAPPPPIATDVVDCDYWDITIVQNKLYYYTVASILGLELAWSDTVISVFTKNTDFIFVGVEGYATPPAHNVNFNW